MRAILICESKRRPQGFRVLSPSRRLIPCPCAAEGGFLGFRIPHDGVPAVESGFCDDEGFAVGGMFREDFAVLFGLFPHRFGIGEQDAVVPFSSVDTDDKVREEGRSGRPREERG